MHLAFATPLAVLLASGPFLAPPRAARPDLSKPGTAATPSASTPVLATIPTEVDLPGVGRVTLRLREFRAATAGVRVDLVGANARGPEGAARAASLSAHLRAMRHLEGAAGGAVVGHPGSSAYFAAGTTGLAAWIDLGDGQGHFTLRANDPEARGLVGGAIGGAGARDGVFVRSSGTSAPEVPTCGCGAEHGLGEGGVAGFGTVPPGARRTVDLAANLDHDFRRIFDSDLAATEYTGALVGAIAAIYRRDADATIRISHLVVETDPADLFNDPDPLYQFRDYWNANGGDIERDLFTLLTGRRDLPYGGVAWLNAACGDFGYSVNGYLNGVFADPVATNPGNWDINVAAHEFGHNLGTLHTHNYGIDSCASGAVQRGTIMSYCHVVSGASSNIDLRFHRGTAAEIENFLSGAPCLGWDCDEDGVDDADEIAADPSLDANGDGILDACQDCNANGTPDPVEIAAGAEDDLDGDGMPDSCETDCDANGVADSVEIALDAALDLDGNMALDRCQTDCDANGVADSLDILADMSIDRSRDGRIDACEDCDGDGVDDFTALMGSRSRWVASAGDALLRELDPRSGVVRRTVVCGQTPARDLAIGADGRLYAAVGNRVYAFDRTLDEAASPLAPVFLNEVAAVAAAPDGRLAVLMVDGRISLVGATGGEYPWIILPVASNARDIVFRETATGTEALVSYANGVIRRHRWLEPSIAIFADLVAAAPDLRGLYAHPDGSVLVASGAQNAILRVVDGATEGVIWDVDNGALVNDPYAIADAGDGRAVLATGTASSSTINGFNLASGYTERTYRVYPADAPQATAIVVAPPSASDANGNLVPDACEGRAADLDGDGAVGAADLAILLGQWGACAGCAADLDGDGMVGASDLAQLLGDWG
jgi:hypothetical protein